MAKKTIIELIHQHLVARGICFARPTNTEYEVLVIPDMGDGAIKATVFETGPDTIVLRLLRKSEFPDKPDIDTVHVLLHLADPEFFPTLRRLICP